MKGSCHCGAVTIEVTERPDYLNQCNCSVCFKLGTLWGYYRPASVRIAGDPVAYGRADRERPTLDFNFCGRCGSTTHWSAVEEHDRDRLGVNMRLFDPEELDGLEVRYGDRRHDEEGEPRSYARAPTVFGAGGPEA